MNKNGTPANLVAAHPGNANALRYGIYSPGFIGALAAEIEANLFGNCELSPHQRTAAHEVATHLAYLRQIDLDLGERGLLDKKGAARDLLATRLRYSRQLERWSAKLESVLEEQADAAEDIAGTRAAIVRELRRIALGRDSTARASDRLEALQLLLSHEDKEAEESAEVERAVEKFNARVLRLVAQHEAREDSTAEDQAQVKAGYAEHPNGEDPPGAFEDG